VDYGQPVRFGVFITPDATQPDRPLALAELADELDYDLIALTLEHGMDTYLIGDSGDDPEGTMRRFAEQEVAPRVRESVAKARA
jgi:hypothetical protein